MNLRLFTVEEANETLAALRPLLETLVRKKAELVEKQAELALLLKAAQTSSDRDRVERLLRGKEELKFIAEEFNVSLHEVSRIGCLVKDVDMGLVDFPAIRDGREVLLCWRLGEPRVAHWHRLEEGFIGRKPLDGQAGAATWGEGEIDAEAETADDPSQGDDAGSPTYH